MRQYNSLLKLKSFERETQPLISLGARVKNEIKAIKDFWNSVKRQTYFEFVEIVFLDSGSIDGTVEFLLQQECNIYSIESNEFSFGDSCNLIMSLTSCEHVIFLSGHVILEQDFLIENIHTFLKTNGPASGYFRQVPNLSLGCSLYDSVYLKYNFKKLNSQLPEYQQNNNHFSNAASLVARMHWLNVKFSDVIASEDFYWATEVVKLFGGVYYFHYLNIKHSHNESYDDVYARVRINVKARFPNGVGFFKRSKMFLKVFTALFINSFKLFPSLKFAYAHSSAYKIN